MLVYIVLLFICIFCCAQTIQKEIEKRNLARANEEQSPNIDSSQPENNILHSVVYNSVVMVGFALFIYLVRYVLYNMNVEWNLLFISIMI